MKNLVATQTLAKLYEKQEMYMEAYIIYKKIFLDTKSEEIKKKITELGEKIIDESQYSQITLNIFDKKELAEYSIFPEKQYKKIIKVIDEMTKQKNYEEILESYQENTEIKDDIKNYSGEEIYEIIQTNFGDKKPEEIKLADIYEIIKEK